MLSAPVSTDIDSVLSIVLCFRTEEPEEVKPKKTKKKSSKKKKAAELEDESVFATYPATDGEDIAAFPVSIPNPSLLGDVA